MLTPYWKNTRSGRPREGLTQSSSPGSAGPPDIQSAQSWDGSALSRTALGTSVGDSSIGAGKRQGWTETQLLQPLRRPAAVTRGMSASCSSPR